MEHPMQHKMPMSPEVAQASETFDLFCGATTLKTILAHHRHLCELLRIKPTHFPLFYPKLKSKLRSWKAEALWTKFDKRASHKCYNRGKACPNTRVLVIGAGPCGLRTAIDAQLLGAKVVLVEKRDRYSRNNVLHLWPFVITDLRGLNAKKFFGKFCAGAIDHISIRQLQCILLKVALILGVEVHESVGFEEIIPPHENQSGEKVGWRAVTSPPDHPVSQYEFDVLVGADGKRNTLEGFKRKEFRGKLAIAITANFINHRTEAEARVQEISGVAFIFNQKFFKDLYAATGIDLENIVYYKDETHYFVMTAKKQSLIDKGVILRDYTDAAMLLSRDNVNTIGVQEYAREAADFCTNYQLPKLEFAVNHYGKPDVAMFDFTSMFAAESASRVMEREGYRLLILLVGDSLLEPFWPTGSGCARGFLSSMDACWAIRSWGSGQATPLEVLAERESIYRILGQTTPENLNRNFASYSLDPQSRYPNLNTRFVIPFQVRRLYDTDDPTGLEQALTPPSAVPHDTPKKRRRKDEEDTLGKPKKKSPEMIQNEMLLSARKKLRSKHRMHGEEDTLVEPEKDSSESNIQNPALAARRKLRKHKMHGEEDTLVEPEKDSDEANIQNPALAARRKLRKHKMHGEEDTLVEPEKDSSETNIQNPALAARRKLRKHKMHGEEDTLVEPEKDSDEANIQNPALAARRKLRKHKMHGEEDTLVEPEKDSSETNIQNPALAARRKLRKHKMHGEEDTLVEPGKDSSEAIDQNPALIARRKLRSKHRTHDSKVHPDTLLQWLKKQVAPYVNVHVENMTDSFKDGMALCAIIHRYRPDLIDFHALKPKDVAHNNQLAFDTLERELGILPVMTGQEMEHCKVPDKLTMLSYLSQVYDTFRGEIPHIKHPKLEGEGKDDATHKPRATRIRQMSPGQMGMLLSQLTSPHSHRKRPLANRDSPGSAAAGERRTDMFPRRQAKRKSSEHDRLQTTKSEEREKRLEEIRQNRLERQIRRQYLRKLTTQQFYKSMQMLQSNAKPGEDSTPFEDFSIFLYRQTASNFQDRVRELERKLLYPDREEPEQLEGRPGETNEEFSGRIKTIEEKLKGSKLMEKKPKDLRRAIGKIDKSDWNVKEIEKKIHENKMGRGAKRDRPEKVPKWSRQQFVDKFQAVQSKLQHKNSAALEMSPEKDKYAEIDVSLLKLGRKLKEGSVLDSTGPRGSNKVSAMAEQFTVKSDPLELESKPVLQKSNSKTALILPSQGGSESCHFCGKRVYLMERLSAVGKFFHRGCFRCEYCSTGLRLNNYLFDRDGKYGSRFFCMQHFGLQGKLRVRRKSDELKSGLGKENVPSGRVAPKTPEKAKSLNDVTPSRVDLGRDMLDMRTTPERIEFENLAGAALDVEEAPSEMDEDEWTDRNFGASAAEGSSDSMSDLSDSDDEEEENEVFEEQPLTSAQTRQLAETWQRRHSKPTSPPAKPVEGLEAQLVEAQEDEEEESESGEYEDSDGEMNYQEYESDDDESDTATEGEGEEDAKARALRRLEVPIPTRLHGRDSDTGSDTEVASEYSSESESEEVENSATEIETDSEFEHDGTTPTQHNIPAIMIDHPNINYRRRQYVAEEPKRVHVRTCHIERPVNGTVRSQKPLGGVKLEISPLRPEPDAKSVSLSNLTSGNNVINNNLNSRPPTVVAPIPIINPRRGDYFLNRTHSTEGIASKMSLELKKKYLLGASGLAGSVKKSGSASTLDSKVKSIVDVISEHQKLLNPAPEPSPTMQAFLQGTSNLRVVGSGMPHSPPSPTSLLPTLKLPPSPSQQTALLLRKQKELPQIGDKFEHVCGLGKKEEPSRLVENTAVIAKQETPTSLRSFAPEIPPLANGSREDVAAKSPTTTQVSNIISDQVEEADCRPRSPVHETSIVVPDIPWKATPKSVGGDDIESDSLSSDGSMSELDEDEESDGHRSRSPSPVVARERTPPRVEIHNSSGELMEVEGSDRKDVSSGVGTDKDNETISPVNSSIDASSRGKKKVVEPLFFDGKRASLTSDRSSPSTPPSMRGEESESFHNEGTLAALTETELSDWAQDADAVVSEDLDDVEFNINPEFVTVRRHRKTKTNRSLTRGAGPNMFARIARGEDFGDFEDDPGHVCGKSKEESNTSSYLLGNMDNIEFMDTGEEDESDTDELLAATNTTLLKNSGYVQFVDTDDDVTTPVAEEPMQQLLSAPLIPTFVFSECEAAETSDSPETVEALSHIEAINKELIVASAGEEEESLLQPEGTTTDETTTTSELATVKDNLGDTSIEGEVFYTPLREPPEESSETSPEDPGGQAYEDYVRRLQGRISPFSNVRDSIDIRKSRRKSGKVAQAPQSQERIAEEISEDIGNKLFSPATSPTNFNSPSTSRKLEEISRERSKQKDLIHGMVMDKLLAQKKASQERKSRRSRGPLSPTSGAPSSSFDLVASPETPFTTPSQDIPIKDVVTLELPSVALPLETDDAENARQSIHQDLEVPFVDDSVLVTEETEQFFTPLTSFKRLSQRHRPLSMHSSFRLGQRPEKSSSPLPDTPLTNPEAFSLPDIRKALFTTPVVPPRIHQENAKQTAERAREEARSRARLKSDEELGLSPEDYIRALKEKTARRPTMERTKSEPSDAVKVLDVVDLGLGEMQTSITSTSSATSSTPQSKATFYLDHPAPSSEGASPKDRKKTKDPERRKSIIQAVSEFFHKKKDSSASPSPPKTPTTSSQTAKERFRFKFTKSKEKGKSAYSSWSDDSDDKLSPTKLDEQVTDTSRSRSVSEARTRRQMMMFLDAGDSMPPPIPPPPSHYLGNGPTAPRASEDSFSEAEDDSRATALSTASHDAETGSSMGSLNRRQSRMQRRVARQAQLKRLRMAQEIQRQLEEVEVKQRELESRGVSVEKALRGEGTADGLDVGGQEDEAELLREWFDLVRERSELRRYEHELLVQAEELELEDRHARLQQELRDRLARDDSDKSGADVAKEGQILAEMLEIVERRDSLIALMEVNRQRYQEEDRDLEAQMLAKGLRLTPLRKESHV